MDHDGSFAHHDTGEARVRLGRGGDGDRKAEREDGVVLAKTTTVGRDRTGFHRRQSTVPLAVAECSVSTRKKWDAVVNLSKKGVAAAEDSLTC